MKRDPNSWQQWVIDIIGMSCMCFVVGALLVYADVIEAMLVSILRNQ